MKKIVVAITSLTVAVSVSLTDYPTDCRGQSWEQDGGELQVMSWHIHYNTDASDQTRFYKAFVSNFLDYFADDHQCPFGPNYGSNAFAYVCSLEGELQEHSVGIKSEAGGGPWDGPQRAFFIPAKYGNETWQWTRANKGSSDVLKHPNTGCMHDDHSLRANWDSVVRDKCDLYPSYCSYGSCAGLVKVYPCDTYFGPGQAYGGWCDKTCGFPPTNPVIDITEFPCNIPGTGCIDSDFPGPPGCGCAMPLSDDSPDSSCVNCINQLV